MQHSNGSALKWSAEHLNTNQVSRQAWHKISNALMQEPKAINKGIFGRQNCKFMRAAPHLVHALWDEGLLKYCICNGCLRVCSTNWPAARAGQ